MALSLETLKKRWNHSLLCTDEVICRHSEAYKELKCLVCRINNETIDIGQYLELAKHIASLLNTITAGKVEPFSTISAPASTRKKTARPFISDSFAPTFKT
jgi:hypothetical protein